ncbi:MAG: hypothetical protein U0869_07245 [Chloroflexota bacterium]
MVGCALSALVREQGAPQRLRGAGDRRRGHEAFAALYLETAARVGFEETVRGVPEVYAAWERSGARLLVAYGPTGDPAATLMLLGLQRLR